MSTSISAATDLEEWFVRYAGRLRRVARRIVGNEHDADDALQDAFLAAFRAHDRYRAEYDPYPWLLRITTRKALTIAAGHRGTADADPEGLIPAVPSAEDEVLAREQAYRVQRLVATELPLKLHLIDGLRFRDVSERLGIPAATAATRIRRGKHRLRTLINASFAAAATPSDEPRSKTA